MKLKEVFWAILHQLEHNEHYITVYFFKKEIKACARCYGMYLGMLAALPIMALLSLTGRFEFWHIFSISWLLASLAIVDWGTVKAKIWHGNNYVRLFTGFSLGTAGMMYLFLLPVPLIYRIASLWGFAIAFDVIHYGILCKEHGLSLRNPIPQNLAIIGMLPLNVGQIGFGHTGGICDWCSCSLCKSLSAIVFNPVFCCCVGVIPIVCIAKSCMDKSLKTPAGSAPFEPK